MSTALAGANERFIRQEDFVPINSLEGKSVTIIGCGAIGRQAAIQLTAIGVKCLQLIDFDTVTPTNVTTQGFASADIGKEKVFALSETLQAIDPAVQLTCICDRFRPKYAVGEVVFLCVDTIQARTAIWRALQESPNPPMLVVDGRMLGEVMRVLAVSTLDDKAHYEKTLFPPEQQEQGRCTGQGTIYCASIAAGLMVHQFSRHLRGMPVDVDMSMNLLAGELCPVIEP